MDAKVLTKEQLQDLYKQYLAESPWPDWERDYLATVKKFSNLSSMQLSERRYQEELWKAKGVASLGSGESVGVAGAYQDEDVIGAIVELKNRGWSDDKNIRAKELQTAYDAILKKVHPKHSRVRPQAKLGRLIAALVPEHTFTGFNWKSRQDVKKLILGDKSVDPYGGAGLIRERLREVLGAENSLEEHIRRSIFCWWLHTHFDEIAAGDPIEDRVTKSTDPTAIEDDQKLALWPFMKQGKGLTAVSGYVEAYRLVISAAKNGATPEDIVDTMRSDLGFEQSPSSCRSIFNNVRRVGFLEHKGGVWYPSEDGIRLTEEDPPDILVEKFLVETFGLAHFLKILEQDPGISRKEIYGKMRKLYPSWTSDMAPSSIFSWAKSLGLVDTDRNSKPYLTDYGAIWCRRLPEELEKPEFNETRVIDSPEDPEVVDDNGIISWPKLADIIDQISSDKFLASFVFESSQIKNLHVAWHCNPIKRFVLLSGLSGTGKTAILFHYARVYCELVGVDVNKHRAVVSVSPDWRDPTGLLGYFNALHADPTFQLEPALRLVLDAVNNQSLPYFLILDEMNLARVERYFAPFLSAMETGEQLHLHAHSDAVNGVPPSIKWPKNLFIGGTVNMDETTHPFSDKVLDRAFTFEFWDVDLEKYLNQRVAVKQGNRYSDLEMLLLEIHKFLQLIRRQFAYRTMGEILDYFDKAQEEEWLSEENFWQITDQVVFAKVLPRIRGEESEIFKHVLSEITAICEDRKLHKCIAKLKTMQNQLNSIGVTRFWT